MSKSLDGNVAVVTGGTQGIGFAIAEEFVEQGATVVLTRRARSERSQCFLRATRQAT